MRIRDWIQTCSLPILLALTILIMSGATFCFGLIPSYESIGIWATLMLIVLRLIQGFSTGSEYGGAATFMAEYAPDNRRGFCGSFQIGKAASRERVCQYV